MSPLTALSKSKATDAGGVTISFTPLSIAACALSAIAHAEAVRSSRRSPSPSPRTSAASRPGGTTSSLGRKVKRKISSAMSGSRR
jgi:hypothetical protein